MSRDPNLNPDLEFGGRVYDQTSDTLLYTTATSSDPTEAASGLTTANANRNPLAYTVSPYNYSGNPTGMSAFPPFFDDGNQNMSAVGNPNIHSNPNYVSASARRRDVTNMTPVMLMSESRLDTSIPPPVPVDEATRASVQAIVDRQSRDPQRHRTRTFHPPEPNATQPPVGPPVDLSNTSGRTVTRMFSQPPPAAVGASKRNVTPLFLQPPPAAVGAPNRTVTRVRPQLLPAAVGAPNRTVTRMFPQPPAAPRRNVTRIFTKPSAMQPSTDASSASHQPILQTKMPAVTTFLSRPAKGGNIPTSPYGSRRKRRVFYNKKTHAMPILPTDTSSASWPPPRPSGNPLTTADSFYRGDDESDSNAEENFHQIVTIRPMQPDSDDEPIMRQPIPDSDDEPIMPPMSDSDDEPIMRPESSSSDDDDDEDDMDEEERMDAIRNSATSIGDPLYKWHKDDQAEFKRNWLHAKAFGLRGRGIRSAARGAFNEKGVLMNRVRMQYITAKHEKVKEQAPNKRVFFLKEAARNVDLEGILVDNSLLYDRIPPIYPNMTHFSGNDSFTSRPAFIVICGMPVNMLVDEIIARRKNNKDHITYSTIGEGPFDYFGENLDVLKEGNTPKQRSDTAKLWKKWKITKKATKHEFFWNSFDSRVEGILYAVLEIVIQKCNVPQIVAIQSFLKEISAYVKYVFGRKRNGCLDVSVYILNLFFCLLHKYMQSHMRHEINRWKADVTDQSWQNWHEDKKKLKAAVDDYKKEIEERVAEKCSHISEFCAANNVSQPHLYFVHWFHTLPVGHGYNGKKSEMRETRYWIELQRIKNKNAMRDAKDAAKILKKRKEKKAKKSDKKKKGGNGRK